MLGDVQKNDDDRCRGGSRHLEDWFGVDGQPALLAALPCKTHDLIPQGFSGSQGDHGRMIADRPWRAVRIGGHPRADDDIGGGDLFPDIAENGQAHAVPMLHAPVGGLDDDAHGGILHHRGGSDAVPQKIRTSTRSRTTFPGLKLGNALSQRIDFAFHFLRRFLQLSHGLSVARRFVTRLNRSILPGRTFQPISRWMSGTHPSGLDQGSRAA